MKKKILAVVCALAALSLSGCGEGDKNSSGVSLTNSDQSTQIGSSSEENSSSSAQSSSLSEQSSSSSDQNSSSSEQSGSSSEQSSSAVISTTAPTSTPSESGEGSMFEVQLKDGGAVITKYKGGGGAVVVPSELSGRRVTEIERGAFSKRADITSIVLPDTVTEIEEYAFQECIALKTADLGGVTGIDEGAFYGCASLVSVEMRFVDEISEFAFFGCGGLENVSIPFVTNIGDSAFDGCSSLRSVTFGERLEEIDDYAFSGCTKLIAVTLPTRLEELGRNVFNGCRSIKVSYKNDIYDYDMLDDLRQIINNSR